METKKGNLKINAVDQQDTVEKKQINEIFFCGRDINQEKLNKEFLELRSLDSQILDIKMLHSVQLFEIQSCIDYIKKGDFSIGLHETLMKNPMYVKYFNQCKATQTLGDLGKNLVATEAAMEQLKGLKDKNKEGKPVIKEEDLPKE